MLNGIRLIISLHSPWENEGKGTGKREFSRRGEQSEVCPEDVENREVLKRIFRTDSQLRQTMAGGCTHLRH